MKVIADIKACAECHAAMSATFDFSALNLGMSDMAQICRCDSVAVVDPSTRLTVADATV
jgi:hypothetical protein